MIHALVQTFLRVQSTICLTVKLQIAPQKDIIEMVNERVYGMHLRMLLKIDVRVQKEAKSGQLKIESMSESANGKTINAFDVRLMIQFRVHLTIHLELHLDVQEGAPDVAPKGTLLVSLELLLLMQ